MQVCGVSLKNPPLIFSTVGGIAGYFITHNFNRTFSGIVSSVALETIWGLASEPKHPKFAHPKRRVRQMRISRALYLGVSWAGAGLMYACIPTEWRKVQYSYPYFRGGYFLTSSFTSLCKAALCPARFDPLWNEWDFKTAKAFLITDLMASIGGIAGLWIGVKTNTSIPVGAAIGCTLGVVAEKISNCVRRRPTLNVGLSPA